MDWCPYIAGGRLEAKQTEPGDWQYSVLPSNRSNKVNSKWTKAIWILLADTLLDKMNVAFKQGEFISYKSLIEFKKLVKSSSVSKNTIVFNNLVLDIDDFIKNWEVPAEKSWHARFFNG